mgnify:CR=1 FL=1
MTPVVARSVMMNQDEPNPTAVRDKNDPAKIMNSPTKPLVPGSPIELKVMMTKNSVYQGITFASPPKSSSSRE